MKSETLYQLITQRINSFGGFLFLWFWFWFEFSWSFILWFLSWIVFWFDLYGIFCFKHYLALVLIITDFPFGVLALINFIIFFEFIKVSFYYYYYISFWFGVLTFILFWFFFNEIHFISEFLCFRAYKGI